MKILQLISSIGFFGAENAMFELSKALQAQGYYNCIGIIGNSGCFPSEFISLAKDNRIEVQEFSCRGKFDLKTIFEIRRYIKNNNIDIVHSHNYKSNFYGFFASLNMRVKRMATCHNWLSCNAKMKFYELIDKYILKKFYRVIPVSEILMDEILDSGIDKGKIKVIYNGIDVNRFVNLVNHQEIKSSLGIKEGEKVVGTVGRLSNEKGHTYLIQAFSKLVKDFSNLKLLIVGDGPLRGCLESEAKKLRLEERVIFAGIRNDLPRIMAVMDIFVLPSLAEAMPMSLLEAMAAKRPVVATKVGSIPKVIEDGKNGLLVEPKDVDGLSFAIKQLITDTNKASSLSSNAFERVKSEFSAQRMAQEYIQVYNRMSSPRIVLSEIAGRGGICHYTYNLAQALSKYKNVTLITGINYELKNQPRNFELRGIFNRFATNPFAVFKIIGLFRNREVEIVHFQLSQHPAFVLLLCVLAKIFAPQKIIVTAHNVLSHEEKKWEKDIYRRIYRLADKVIVHAQANQSELKQDFGITEDKLAVIPHGNYAFFNELDAHTALPKNSAMILFFGYIRRYKGLLYLIRALKLVKERIPNARLCIAGKPVEDFEIYQDEINKLGLQDSIELNLNYITFDKAKGYFPRANLVVLPYLNIYQSGVLQLAYAFGRPVVATNVGGLKEAIDDGKSGYLVEPADVNSLADKITMVLSNYELQKNMGQYALNLAKTKFSWENIASKTNELYENLTRTNLCRLPILMYHRLSFDNLKERYTVSVNSFEEQMRYLSNTGYRSVLPEDIPNLREECISKSLMITFDDGYESDYNIAYSLLKKYGLKGVFFIATDLVGKEGYMSWQQIQNLKEEGHSIQSHSQTHSLMATLDKDAIRRELSLSKNALKEKLKINVNSLALPGGSYKKKIKEIFQDEGYQYIFSSKPGVNILDNGSIDFFYRILITQHTKLDEFKNIVSLNAMTYSNRKFDYLIKQSLKKIIGQRRYYRVWKEYFKSKKT